MLSNMTSVLYFSLLLAFLTCSSGRLTPSEICDNPPVKTIPVRIAQFKNNTLIFYHALVNGKKEIDNTKCRRDRSFRSPTSETQSTVLGSQQNLLTGAITTRTYLVTELCPGIWEFQDKNNSDNYNIYYKMWTDDHSLVDFIEMYKNDNLVNDVYVFFSTKRDVTEDDITRGFQNANVKIRSLVRISQDNCED